VERKFIVVFIALITHHFSSAQCTDYLFRDQVNLYNSTITVFGNYSIGSNAITNQFFGKFYKGGFIDADLKDKVSEKMINQNRFGADISAGVEYLYLPDTLFGKRRLGFFAAARDREHFDTQFSKDLFHLGFYGNKDFAGKTADMNNFNLNLLRYQQVQVGFLWAGLDTAKAKLGIGVSVLKGEQLLSIMAKKAELYTSSDGQYIDLTTSATMHRSDTSSKGFSAMNGTGASIDVFLEAPYIIKKRKGVITIRVTDMGAIFWNNNSLTYSTDSTYHYTGYKVENLFDLQDSTFKSNSTSDIANNNLNIRHKGYSTTIPATINISTNTFYGKFNFIKGFRYMFNANYKGLFYVKGNYFITPKVMLGITVGYGGYSNFNYGIEVAAMLGKSFSLHAGSNNVEGFLVPKNTTAQGAFMVIKKHF